jgi:ketosteroid isomerase-like protein
MTATVVLPDSAAGATDTTRTLFKELLTEGDYGSGTAGFDIDLVFTRGTSDTITINVPANQDGASGTGGNNQGAFIRSANTSVSTDNPVSTEVDVLFRNMSATIVDSEPVYP